VTTEENPPIGRASLADALAQREQEPEDWFTDDPGASDTGDDWVTDTSPAPLVSAESFEAASPGAQAPAPVILPVWGLLSEAEETAQLASLWQFVPWLAARHELTAKIRPCWPLHGPAVEALTALHQRWLEVYLRAGWGGDAAGGLMDTQTNRGYEALVWLEQLDTRCERLAKSTFTRCVAGHHDDDQQDEDWLSATQYFGKVARTEAPPVSG
jgi:hypothetical protein